MSMTIHLISSPILPGYGVPSDYRCSNSSYIFPLLKNLSMTCSAKSNFFIIKCSSSGKYEKNPDYFYRPDQFRSYEYKSKFFNPKSGYSRFQSRSTGENDKEVIELFRKVKAQLREKAMRKKQGNIEDSSRRPKKDISSLIEILEKHSNPVTYRSEHMKVYRRNPRVNQTVDSKEAEPVLPNNMKFEEIIDDDICENDGDDDGRNENSNEMMMIEDRDFSTMKISELRSLAKSRGLKGVSKLTKSELSELLSE